MLIIETLINILFATKVCQGLTIYQPNYLNYSRPKTKAAIISNISQQYFQPQIFSTQQETPKLSLSSPYEAGSISNILSQTLSKHNNISPGYSAIYPVQYQYKQSLETTHPKFKNVLEQPVTAAKLESEILHENHDNLQEIIKQRKPISTVNYNNKIYHININNSTMKRASPLTNNNEMQEEKYPKNIVRKQRNLKKNHDDKLIEQNNKEIRNANDVNDQQDSEAAASYTESSIKQPSSSKPTKTSHEIRYLQ